VQSSTQTWTNSHDVGPKATTVDELHEERFAVAADAVDRRLLEQRDAAGAVHVADPSRDLAAERPRQRPAGLHHGRVQSTRRGHARHLGADEPATDDHDAPGRVEHVREAPGVAQLAEREDPSAVRRGGRTGSPPTASTRRS
jgi:hypothetical protein